MARNRKRKYHTMYNKKTGKKKKTGMLMSWWVKGHRRHRRENTGLRLYPDWEDITKGYSTNKKYKRKRRKHKDTSESEEEIMPYVPQVPQSARAIEAYRRHNLRKTHPGAPKPPDYYIQPEKPFTLGTKDPEGWLKYRLMRADYDYEEAKKKHPEFNWINKTNLKPLQTHIPQKDIFDPSKHHSLTLAQYKQRRQHENEWFQNEVKKGVPKKILYESFPHIYHPDMRRAFD